MGEACKDALRVNFDNQLKLEFHGARITSDAGFSIPELYELLEAEGYGYAIRLKAMPFLCNTSGT